MQEAARGSYDVHLVAGLRDIDPVERLHRAVRLALRRAEGGEVMASDEVRRTVAHRFEVERHRNVPDPTRVQSRRGAAAKDSVEIAPPDAGEASVPVVGDGTHLHDGDRLWPNERIQSLAQPVRRQAAL